MNLKMKVKLYERQGMKREDALIKVLGEAQVSIDEMDKKLSLCISTMTRDDVTTIFGGDE